MRPAPSRRSLFGVGVGALAVSVAGPSPPAATGMVLDKGRRLRGLVEDMERLEQAAFQAVPPGRDRLFGAAGRYSRQAWSLTENIALSQPETMADVATLAAAVTELGCSLFEVQHNEEDLQRQARRVAMGAASITRWAMARSGVDPNSITWADLDVILDRLDGERQAALGQVQERQACAGGRGPA